MTEEKDKTDNIEEGVILSPQGEESRPSGKPSDEILRQNTPQDDTAVQPEELVEQGELVLAQKHIAGAPVKDGENPLHVKIAMYDGPLDLLLDLIKKNEMDIYNIQVSEITSQYLAYLARIKQLDLEIAGEFIVMAATLLYIKSKMLLPQDDKEDEEEGGDPRAELVRKLLEYQAFKHAAKELGFLEDERGKVFTRQLSEYYLSEMDAADVDIDNFSANLFDLLTAFQTVLAKGANEAIHEVFEQVVSIEDKMSEIRTRLLENKKFAFSDLFKAGWTRNLLIVTFLAVLETVRTKIARVVQEKQYGEIYIEQIPEAIGA